MPRAKQLTAIFEGFVTHLSAAIQQHVTAAVSKATTDFMNGPVARTVKAAAEKIPRRRRRRRVARGKQPRLSKNGKRIGRPPKAV